MPPYHFEIFDPKYQNSVFSEWEKQQIIDITMVRRVHTGVYEFETYEESLEERNAGQKTSYVQKNKNSYAMYLETDNGINLYYIGTITFVLVEKVSIVYKKIKFYFYRVSYIDGDFISFKVFNETDTDRIYHCGCSLAVKVIFPPFEVMEEKYG